MLGRPAGRANRSQSARSCRRPASRTTASARVPDREYDITSIEGDCRAAKDLRSLTTPQLRSSSVASFQILSPVPVRGNIQKNNLGPVAERILCQSSAEFEPPSASRSVNQRSANARVFFSDLRVSQPDGDRQRLPPAMCTGQVQKSAYGKMRCSTSML